MVKRESIQTMVIPMGKDFSVTIMFHGETTQKRINQFVAHIELIKMDFPKDITSTPPSDLK